MSDKVRKLAQHFLLKYGPLTRDSATYVVQQFKQNRIELLNGISPLEAQEALQTAMAVSYVYNPTRYNQGPEYSPSDGKTMLDRPELQNREVQEAIASYIGPHSEYAQRISEIHNPNNEIEPNQENSVSDAANTQEETATPERSEATENPTTQIDNGLSVDASNEQESNPTEQGYHIYKNSGGYTRVSQMNGEVINKDIETKRPSASVTPTAGSSQGYVYRGSLGSGDSRNMRNAGNTTSNGGD